MSLSPLHPEAHLAVTEGLSPGRRSVLVQGVRGATELEIGTINLDRLWRIWRDSDTLLRWTCPFTLPPWLQAWTATLGQKAQALTVLATEHERVIGLAPLMVQGRKVFFLGDPDVCDTFDCTVAAGYETAFFGALLDYLASTGIRELDLGPVRDDSAVFEHLPPVARAMGMEVVIERAGESFEVALPATWEGFLRDLTGKQRHEVRRKMRRFEEAGKIDLRCLRLPEEVEDSLPVFLELFRQNRPDKAAFMQTPMEAFFRALAAGLSDAQLLRLFFLDLDGKTVASTFCFDHQGRRYLYNNGYDGAHAALSVSLLSKIMSLREAIGVGLDCFDFLKGSEVYKERLGGREVPLYRCRINC